MVDQDAVSSHLLAKKPGNKDVRVKSKTSVNTPSYHCQDEIGYENTIHRSVYKPTIVASTIVSAPKDVPILVYSCYLDKGNRRSKFCMCNTLNFYHCHAVFLEGVGRSKDLIQRFVSLVGITYRY